MSQNVPTTRQPVDADGEKAYADLPEVDWANAIDMSRAPIGHSMWSVHPHTIPAVLAVEVLAFALGIILIAMNEYLDLPHQLFGAPPTVPRISEVVLEGGLIFILGAGVTTASWVALRRLAYLESLLTLCGSCQNVCIDGRWVRFEAFLAQQDRIQTTHGVCPTCFDREILAE